jgi:hypothetical protein
VPHWPPAIPYATPSGRTEALLGLGEIWGRRICFHLAGPTTSTAEPECANRDGRTRACPPVPCHLTHPNPNTLTWLVERSSRGVG